MSRLIVNQIQGDAVSKEVEIPTGHTLKGTDAASIFSPGNVLQAVGQTFTGQTAVTATTDGGVKITNSDTTITPKASNSKFAVWVQLQCYRNNNGASGYGIHLYRGSTLIHTPYADWSAGAGHGVTSAMSCPTYLFYLDEPTSAPAGTDIVYSVYAECHTSSHEFRFNYSGTWSGVTNKSYIMIQEIAA